VISYRDGRWVLTDLGGSNGTMVDGQFVKEAELEPNHEVRVGDALFKFVPSGAELYARYRIDGEMVAGAARRSRALAELAGGMVVDHIGAQLERVAPAELAIIVQGESGTGKEVVAREIHRLSGRRGPLQAINCAAIPASLIESELFGYKRGAFSGAERDKPGQLAAANGGTLLLDEIGDMPLEAQAKLLRVLQSKEIYPVGATCAETVDVRVVCATNRDLKRLVEQGRFRGDLLARLNEFYLSLPALRDRKEDVFLLCRALLERHGFAKKRMAFPFVLGLMHYDWPYNVRELEGCLKRAASLAETDLLEARHLPETIREAMSTYACRQSSPPAGPAQPEAQPAPAPARGRRRPPPSEPELRELLARHRGNIAAVGRELGKERMQIHRWMRKYGIEVEDYRG
jgi:transcriptional regulator with GAF, ATPase, and Fis domain